MSAPGILLLMNGAACIPSLLLRDRRVLQSVLSIIAGMVIAWIAFSLPLDQPQSFLGMDFKFSSRWMILGRSLILTEATRAAVGMLYASVALVFLGALAVHATAAFYFLGYLMAGAVAAALMIEPIVFAALLFEIAAIFALLLLSGERGRKPRGGFRLLSLFTLGMIAILLTGWMLEDLGGIGSVPQDRRLLLLLGLGFTVLMAVPPFHSWLPIVAEDSQPIAIGLVIVVLQGGGFFFMLHLLGGYEFLGDQVHIAGLIRMTGAVTAVVAGLWSLAQSSSRKAFCYALIAHTGISMICMGLGDAQGFQLAATTTALRTLHILGWALGEPAKPRGASLFANKTGEPVARTTNIMRVASVIGFLGLAGFPLTPGYASRWTLLMKLSAQHPFTLGASSLAMLGIVVSAMRAILNQGAQTAVGTHTWSRWNTVLLFTYTACMMLLSFFPQFLAPWTEAIVSNVIHIP